MTLPAQPRRYTIEEYLEIEGKSEEKYEYRDGHVVNMTEALAMAGGAVTHSLITAHVIGMLGNRLKGGPCRVYESSLRVRIPARAARRDVRSLRRRHVVGIRLVRRVAHGGDAEFVELRASAGGDV